MASSEFQKAQLRARWYRFANAWTIERVALPLAVFALFVSVLAVVFSISTAARADGPDLEHIPRNVLHVQVVAVDEIRTHSPWSVELRGGGGTDGLVEGTLLRRMNPELSVGMTVGWVGQSGSDTLTLTCTETRSWGTDECHAVASSSANSGGLVLYQAEAQYEFKKWRELTPYFGMGFGGFGANSGASALLGFRIDTGPAEAGLAYRVIGSPDGGMVIHAVVFTLRPNW